MIPQDFESFPVFGTDSSMVQPDEPKYSDGFVFGDVLPAEWLNWFLHTMSKGYNELVQYAYEGFTLTISETPPSPLAPTKRLNVVINGSNVALTLGNGPFIGYVLPVTAKAPCTVSYTGSNGATSDSLDTDQIINYIWKGGYWSPSSNFSLPVYISASQTVSPSTPSTYIIDTAGVVLTIADGTYPSCEVSVLAQAACHVTYTGESGTKTDSLTAGDMASYVWMDTYWKYQSVPVTGIDDNGQPFAYNIDSMVEAGGVINITGTDANGNPFDYGLGKLVTVANENNYSTEEVKTTKTWIDGKPIYRRVFTGNLPNVPDGGFYDNKYTYDIPVNYIISCSCMIDPSYYAASLPRFFQDFPSASAPITTIAGGAFVDGGTFTVWFGSNRTSHSNKPALAIVEYTKTTDA